MDARAPAIVKDKPLIFSATSVLAILAGRKGQTRRLVKAPKWAASLDTIETDDEGRFPSIICDNTGCFADLPLPYLIGDHVYVKEAWRTCAGLDDKSPSEIGAACMEAGYSSPWGPVRYEADGTRRAWTESDWPTEEAGRLRSPIHMPRWASRISLTVTDVRVERLQDISEADAIAEGFAVLSKDGGRLYKYGIPDRDGWPGTDNYGWPWHRWSSDPRIAYLRLWSDIHGDVSRLKNPWVAAITFEHRCESGWKPRKVA